MELTMPLAEQDINSIPNTPAPQVSPIQPTGQGNQVAQVQPPIGGSNQATLPPATNLDPQVVAVAQTIKNLESQGNYNAVGDNGSSMGAYQWNNGSQPVAQGATPINWQNAAQEYLGDKNAPMTPANQNYVAYQQIAAYKAKGLSPNSIDALWNGASPDPNNPGQYIHNNPQRATQFSQALQQTIQGMPQGQSQGQGQTQGQNQGQPPSVGGFLQNVAGSAGNLLGNIGNAVLHPIQTVEGLGSAAVGGLQEAGGEQNSNTVAFDNLKNYFVNRYGSVSNLEHTIYTDPVGFAADLSTVLGVGAGALGVAGKAAELGGLGNAAIDAGGADFIASAEGGGGVSQSTEAIGLAGGLKSTASALATGAKYTNPLTPVVEGAGALLNSTRNVSDIISNPTDYSAENIANSTSEKITQDIQNAIETKRIDLSDTGSGYTPFRETPTAITTQPDDIDNILRDSLKVNITDGVIKPTSTSLLRDQPSISKLQNVYNTYKPDFLNGSMDSEKLLNMRTDLAKIAFNDYGVKDTDVASMAAKVRSVINDTYREQIPGLSKLDEDYSSKLNKLDELQDGLVYKTGSNKGELKTSFINSASKAIEKGDAEKLAQLEELSPGITRRLQIMKTIKDLGDPSFTTSLVEKGGVVGGLLTGNIKGAALALTSIILSKPAIAIPLLRAVGANLDLVKQIMGNLAKGVTAGAVVSNAQQSMPQDSGQQTTTDQSPQTTPSPAIQNGSSSSNVTTQTSQYQAAIAAGYTPAEINAYLATQ